MARTIEAVVVCVKYSDFLAWTLPASRNQFDRMVVVTSNADTDTQALCERYNVECVKTDAFYENGDPFNKGKGINAGLDRLSKKGWVVHMDADIYLPPKTRSILDNLPLDEGKMYGCDRLMCPSAEAFAQYLNFPPKTQSDWIYIHPTAFPVGVRLAQYTIDGGGYIPIGFWQLWHPKGSGLMRYPDKHGDAARTDFQHGTALPRERREFLPEIITIHLQTDPVMAVNWKGRKSPPFLLGAATDPAVTDPASDLPVVSPEPAVVPPKPLPLPTFRLGYKKCLLELFLRELLHEQLVFWGQVLARLVAFVRRLRRGGGET